MIKADHRWQLPFAVSSDELLKLFDTVVLLIYEQLRLAVNPIISIQFFLKLNNRLVSFVEPTRKCNHNVSLFKK